MMGSNREVGTQPIVSTVFHPYCRVSVKLKLKRTPKIWRTADNADQIIFRPSDGRTIAHVFFSAALPVCPQKQHGGMQSDSIHGCLVFIYTGEHEFGSSGMVTLLSCDVRKAALTNWIKETLCKDFKGRQGSVGNNSNDLWPGEAYVRLRSKRSKHLISSPRTLHTLGWDTDLSDFVQRIHPLVQIGQVLEVLGIFCNSYAEWTPQSFARTSSLLPERVWTLLRAKNLHVCGRRPNQCHGLGRSTCANPLPCTSCIPWCPILSSFQARPRTERNPRNHIEQRTNNGWTTNEYSTTKYANSQDIIRITEFSHFFNRYPWNTINHY